MSHIKFTHYILGSLFTAIFVLGTSIVSADWEYTNYNIPYTVSDPTPGVNIEADSTSLSYGGSTILRWTSTNASYCTLDVSIPGYAAGATLPTSGSASVSLSATTTYTLTCYN